MSWPRCPRCRRPPMLDLFCKAGGAAMGYYQAGFCVTGVDIEYQRRYPFRFVQADAIDALTHWDLSRFAAIHASPPCQAYTPLRRMPTARPERYPDLVEPVRALLERSGRPWIMENVPGSPVAPHVVLCGTMFGLEAEPDWELRRHRLFELSGFYALTPQHQHNGRTLSVTGKFAGRETRRRAAGVYGNGGGPADEAYHPKGSKASIGLARELMGIDWMTTAEICQAIPPAYTKHLGRALVDHIRSAA